MSDVVVFFVWLVLGALIMAFIEYVLHRWPMHNGRLARKFQVFWNTFEAHAVLHHGRFFKKFDNEPDRAAHHFNINIEPGYSLFGLAPLWVSLMFISFPAGLAMALIIFLHAVVWSAIHTEMHIPKERWFSDKWFFRYARDYHHTHHLHPGSNYAVVFPPVMDMLFGTYRPPTPPPCSRPPAGWYCTRPAGHDGPCAAVPQKSED